MPIWVTLLLIVAIGGGLWYAKADYDEARREEGRVEVRGEWEAAVKAADDAEAHRSKVAEEAAKAKEAQRDKDFRALAARNTALASQLAAARVDALVVERLRDAVRTANEERNSSKPPDGAAATPVSGLCVTNWFDRVAELYSACRTQVACLLRYINDEGVESCGMP